MGVRKSQTVYTGLVENILDDINRLHPEEYTLLELKRDKERIRARVECEGLAFLTNALPLLGKALDRGLETKTLIIPPGFAARRLRGRVTKIPRMFGALFSLVFDSDGNLVPCWPEHVAVLRQLCFVLYKLEVPFKKAQLDAASEKFIRVDERAGFPVQEGKFSAMEKFIRITLARVFREFNPLDVKPRHGPGAVADRLHGREKWNFTFYDRKIDELYPYSVFSTGGVFSTQVEYLTRHLTLGDDIPPSRVCFVPKDSRGPRTISAEPALLQYLQQGIGSALVEFLEKSRFFNGEINFKDQTVNQELALASSRDGRYATLDMQDASDLVSLEHVRRLLPSKLARVLEATRSRCASLPNGKVVRLKKFAPMGSAVCFPVEALIFYMVAQAAICSKRGEWRKHHLDVFVYGDDIVVKTEYAAAVVEALQAFGFAVNLDKCFVQGLFRESCGVDAYNGVDVRPVRLKALYEVRGQSRFVTAQRYVELANAFFDKMFWRTASYLDGVVDSLVGDIPTLGPNSAGIRRTSRCIPLDLLSYRTRWNSHLQRYETRVREVTCRTEESKYPRDEQRLLERLIRGCPEPYSDSVAVYRSCAIKDRWRALR